MTARDDESVFYYKQGGNKTASGQILINEMVLNT